jgi:hypothetical protein
MSMDYDEISGGPQAPAPHDWRQLLQDQTDLVNKAQGQVRMLEGRLKAKDEAHKAEVEALQKNVEHAQRLLGEAAAGQGMVPRELHEARGEKLDRALAKLAATQKYAETQRQAALTVADKYQKLQVAMGAFIEASSHAIQTLSRVCDADKLYESEGQA